jgi:hypothetical protein
VSTVTSVNLLFQNSIALATARYISGERHLSLRGAHEVHEGFGLLLGHLYAENPLYAFLQEAHEFINSKLLNPNTLNPDDLAGIIDIGE